MPDGLAADVWLGDLVHLDGRLDADFDAALLQPVGHGQRIDDRRQHAHVVGPRALHASAAVLQPAFFF